MSFSFNSQISKEKEYSIQITTDNYEQFLFIQEMARQCVDGGHKEKYDGTATFAVPTIEYIPETCKNCPGHPSNGGSGICYCTLPQLKE